MDALKKQNHTLSEYLAIEQNSQIKHEYHNGKVFAMAGGTYNHAVLCGNSYNELRNGLAKKGSQCKTFNSELKLAISNKNSYVYPDAMVICDSVAHDENDLNAVTNPVLVIEVLSKSTAEYDRNDKFHLYRQIPSLREYVLIEQDRAVVEVFFKPEGSDLWKISRYIGLDTSMLFESIALSIKMRELYFDVNLPV